MPLNMIGKMKKNKHSIANQYIMFLLPPHDAIDFQISIDIV